MVQSYDILIQKLDSFIKKFYKNQLIKGLILTLSITLLLFIVIATAEYFGRFSTAFRAILFWAFTGVTLYVLSVYIIKPLLNLYRVGKIISHEQAANIIGKHFSEVKDKLLNVLQLKEMAKSQNDLVLASINQKSSELSPVPFSNAINFSGNKQYLKYALPSVLIIVILLISGNARVLREGSNRVVGYSNAYEIQAPFTFVIENEGLSVLQHEDFTVEVKVDGEEIPDNAYIEINGVKHKMQDKSKVAFNYTLHNVQKATSFRFFADGFYSKSYELKALPNPVILGFSVKLDYPSYTTKKDEIIENTGDLTIPEGTEVSWNFNTKNTEELFIQFPDTGFAAHQAAKNTFAYNNHFKSDLRYYITTKNKFVNGKDTVAYLIRVVKDQFPSIEVEEQRDSLDNKRLFFRGLTKDDYGFKSLTFNYKKQDSDELVSVPLNINTGGTVEQFFHYWDVSQLGIKAGDEVEYYFEVFDNDAINGAKSTRTQTKTFKAPTLDELEEKAEQSNQQLKADMKESMSMVQDLEKELEDIRKKLLEKKELSWEDKKRVEDILKKQKELQKKLNDIKKETKEKNKEQSDYKKVDEDILDKQRQLEELFDKVMTDEMKELYKELEEMMKELNKEKLQEKLEEIKLSNEDIKKELDRNLELFKQLEFEQKLQETIDKLDELKEKQEQLAEETKEGEKDSDELKQEQDELNKEFEELKKDLDDLEKKNSELEDPQKMESTEQEEQEISEEMQKSSEELQKGKEKKAEDSQQKSAEKMEELSEKMQNMQMSMSSESQEENMESLRQILENLVRLSIDQEQLMKDLSETNKNNPRYTQLTREQNNLSDDAKIIEDSLFALSKRVAQIEPFINREMNLINDNMDKAIKQLAERNTPQANNRQQYVMTSSNNLALMLSEVLDQMQKEMSSMMKGDQQCQKPGSNSKPSMSNMRKMQEQLNKQMKDMKGKMKGGKKPGEKSGSGTPGGQRSKELAKMAAQQEAIRQQIQQMADEFQKGGNNPEGEEGEGGMGSMGDAIEKMEQVEEDIVNNDITPETLRRQEEILTRLLEAENAEREREKDNKRKSNEALEQENTPPKDFEEYYKQKQKEAELLKTIPPALQPFYKNKVNEYFNSTPNTD